jgi:hypothetical protein
VIDPNGFLMIEPSKRGHTAIYDWATCRVAALLNSAREGTRWRGWHTCVCGAGSGCCDLWVKIGDKELKTNSLAVHYMACHRDEVPADQMKLIEALTAVTDPTIKQIAYQTPYPPADNTNARQRLLRTMSRPAGKWRSKR